MVVAGALLVAPRVLDGPWAAARTWARSWSDGLQQTKGLVQPMYTIMLMCPVTSKEKYFYCELKSPDISWQRGPSTPTPCMVRAAGRAGACCKGCPGPPSNLSARCGKPSP